MRVLLLGLLLLAEIILPPALVGRRHARILVTGDPVVDQLVGADQRPDRVGIEFLWPGKSTGDAGGLGQTGQRRSKTKCCSGGDTAASGLQTADLAPLWRRWDIGRRLS
jgi:hypothetical protein